MKRGTFWIVFVVGLLVANAVAMAAMIAQAGDPTPRVLPDYYRRAIAWDDTAAARAASRALGWTARVELSGGELQVALVDRAGAPVTGATVEVTVRHRSRADQQQAATLVERAPGGYRAPLALARRGLHEVALRARLGDAAFVLDTVVEP